jgi:hypothetical protein
MKRCNVVIRCHEKMQCCNKMSWKDVILSKFYVTTFYDNIASFHDILWQHCIFSWHFMTTLHLFMTFYDTVLSTDNQIGYHEKSVKINRLFNPFLSSGLVIQKRCNVVITFHEKMQCWKVQKDKQRSTKHTYKTKDWVTGTPLKTGGELKCSRRVSTSCSVS